MSTILELRKTESDLKARLAAALCPRTAESADPLEEDFRRFQPRAQSVSESDLRDYFEYMGAGDPSDERAWEDFLEGYRQWAQAFKHKEGHEPSVVDAEAFLHGDIDFGEQDFPSYETPSQPRQRWEPDQLSDQELLKRAANPERDSLDRHEFHWSADKEPPPEIPLETKNQWKVWEGENFAVLKLPADPAVIQREGVDMNHCLQVLHVPYSDSQARGDIELYSMIDKKTGKPVVDIEVALKRGHGVPVNVDQPTVMQVRGVGNQCPPSDNYVPELMQFFHEYGADWKLSHGYPNFDGKPDGALTAKRWEQLQGQRTGRLLTAATLEELLTGLSQAGVLPEVIEFAKSQTDPAIQGRLLSELKKKPQSTVEELQNILRSTQKRQLPYSMVLQKAYPSVNPATIKIILDIDPTPTKKYSHWLLQQAVKNPEINWKEDAQVVKATLELFRKQAVKKSFIGERDIGKIPSYDALAEIVRENAGLEIEGVERVQRQEIHGRDLIAEYTKPGSGRAAANYKLWRVTTWNDAKELSNAKALGYESNWCIGYTHTSSYFNNYSRSGYIYIIQKNNKPFMCIHCNDFKGLGNSAVTPGMIEEVQPLLLRLPSMPGTSIGVEASLTRYAREKHKKNWNIYKYEQTPAGQNIWGFQEKREGISKIDERVIDAWKAGVEMKGSGGEGKPSIRQYETLVDYRLRTDGKNLYSYGHRIGETWPDGAKVAYSCKWSNTTKSHCWAAAAAADQVREICPSCHPELE